MEDKKEEIEEKKLSVSDGVEVEDLFADEKEEVKADDQVVLETPSAPSGEIKEAVSSPVTPTVEVKQQEVSASSNPSEGLVIEEPVNNTQEVAGDTNNLPNTNNIEETNVESTQSVEQTPVVEKETSVPSENDGSNLNSDGTYGEKPKSNKKTLIIMGILILLLVIVVVYMYVLKPGKEENNNNNNINVPPVVDNTPQTPTYDETINSEAENLVKRLVIPSFVDVDNLKNMNFYYAQENLKPSTMNNVAKMAVALVNSNYITGVVNDKGNYVIEESILKTSYQQIFGSIDTYKYEDILNVMTKQADGKIEVVKELPMSTSKDAIIERITNTKTTDDVIEVYVKVAYLGDDTKVYTKTDKLTVVDPNLACIDKNVCDITTHYDKLDTYKYIFRKENTNYYFESVELVK